MTINKTTKSARMRKAFFFSMLSLLFVVAVPLIPYAFDALAVDAKQSTADNKVAALPNPAINLWNNVRQRDARIEGSSQVKSVDSGVLINKTGEDWRRFRLEKLVPYGAYLMGGILASIVLFYLVKGKTRIPGGHSGKRIPRFTLNQRTAHWFTAGVFWLLAITGLILLYGKFVLIPLLGPEGFSITASACKEMHNLFGPLFLLAVLAMLVLFIKDNFFNLGDLKWFAKGGGMFGGHASAGRFNAGEKTWFWLVMIFGISLGVSGLILEFSVLGQGREVMALSHVFHGISALVLISVSFGHIFLGTVGVEGTLESMTTGSVDAAWAKAHHDQWYEEMTGESGEIESGDETVRGDIAQSGIASPGAGS
jgi:formate dehydrogenase subunit gamma